MKELTLVLEDDALCMAIESAAKSNGVTLEEVVIDAIRYWKSESELTPEEEAEIEVDTQSNQEDDRIPHDELVRILEEDNAKLREGLHRLEKDGGAEGRLFLAMLREKLAPAQHDSISSKPSLVSTA